MKICSYIHMYCMLLSTLGKLINKVKQKKKKTKCDKVPSHAQ